MKHIYDFFVLNCPVLYEFDDVMTGNFSALLDALVKNIQMTKIKVPPIP